MPHRPSRSEAERSVGTVARLGLAGRTGFYLILAAISIRLALFQGASSGSSRPDNAQGALGLVGSNLLGRVAIGAVAAGFLLLGVTRLVAAVKDHRSSTGERITTGLNGLFYLALTSIPVSFLVGNSSAGSEQQQKKTTARLLGLPFGREIVVLVGASFVAVCAFQIKGAASDDFADGMRTESSSEWVRSTVKWAGRLGIAARATIFLPIGIFLIVAGVTFDPNRSHGLDGELLELTGHWWGTAVLALVAVGFFIFSIYSGLETRYRDLWSA